MADFLGVSYAAICKAALIPAILYYLSLWFMLDLEAVKMGMKRVPKSERPFFDGKAFIKKIYMVGADCRHYRRCALRQVGLPRGVSRHRHHDYRRLDS